MPTPNSGISAIGMTATVAMRGSSSSVCVKPVCEHLCAEGIFSRVPDQVIINEYQPGQGISAHVDCVPCFGDTIASLSLGSACVMDLTHSTSHEKQSHLLEPLSLVVLSGDARYHWQHAIPARKSDKWYDQSLTRVRRISLTFRNVVTT